jgi:hypothetical protein
MVLQYLLLALLLKLCVAQHLCFVVSLFTASRIPSEGVDSFTTVASRGVSRLPQFVTVFRGGRVFEVQVLHCNSAGSFEMLDFDVIAAQFEVR